jgi:hypothetical protein
MQNWRVYPGILVMGHNYPSLSWCVAWEDMEETYFDVLHRQTIPASGNIQVGVSYFNLTDLVQSF